MYADSREGGIPVKQIFITEKTQNTHTLGKNETFVRKHCDALHTMGVMNLAMVQDAGDARKGGGNRYALHRHFLTRGVNFSPKC